MVELVSWWFRMGLGLSWLSGLRLVEIVSCAGLRWVQAVGLGWFRVGFEMVDWFAVGLGLLQCYKGLGSFA